MAGVIADLVDVRRQLARQAIILLQIDGQICLRLLANFSQRLGVLLAIDGNPDNVCRRLVQQIHQLHRRINVLGVCRRHTLHGDWMSRANGDRADADGSRCVAHDSRRRLHGCPAQWWASEREASAGLDSRSSAGSGKTTCSSNVERSST